MKSRGLAVLRRVWNSGVRAVLRRSRHSTFLLVIGCSAIGGNLQAQMPPAPGSVLVRVSSFDYDAEGLLIKEVIEPDRPNDCLQTTYTHDAYGNRVTASSGACPGASGHAVSSAAVARTTTSAYAAQTVSIGGIAYSYPIGVFATSSTNALSQSEHKEYDPRHGGVTKLTGPNGGVTTWTYDGFGRKTRENRADGTYTVWTYQLCAAPGQPPDAMCTGPVGLHEVHWYVSEASYGVTHALIAPEKYQFYDTLDRVVRVQTRDFDGLWVVQDTHFNALGQIAQKSILHRPGETPHWTTYAYDALGRVTSESGPDGNNGTAVTQFAYNGLVTTVTNPLNQTQTTHKNASGQTAKVVDHLGSEVLYVHDALGQLIETNAAGVVTQVDYNRRGQKQSMRDPSMGAWDYAYNAFGELVWQQDSLSQTTTTAYDALGRTIQRTEPDLTSHWHYDKKADNSSCGAGIGKLCEATANNGYRRVHAYDSFGRPISTATALDSAVNLATVSQTYEPNTGRLASQTWPTEYQVTYGYNLQGFLQQVTGGGVTGHTQVVSLEVLAMDPQGRITQYRQGNDVTTVKTYDQPTGKLHSVQATKNGHQSTGNVLDHAYTYDQLGNLLSRRDVNTGVTENYQYDSLNRLSLYQIMGGGVSGVQSIQTLYDARGNLKYKSDVGYYHYDPARPYRLNHVTLSPESGWSAIGAVTQANVGTRALSYAFDDARPGARSVSTGSGLWSMGNGNLWYTVSQDQVNGRHTVRWETYTSFNMPSEIMLGDLTDPNNPTAAIAERTLNFAYGPEHQRIRQTVALTSSAPSHMEAGTTWYLNGTDSQGLTYEKEVKDNGTIEHKHYVNAGGMSFALYVKREGNLNGQPATTISYFHHDHLGSVAVITEEAGTVTERLAYDPWGKRRHVNGTPDALDALYGVHTDRGYTMHEHLDEMGIVHMNGRLYDPLIGRFMSADPYIQFPGNLQSHNRYAYVLNNPLAYTDPNGYRISFKKALRMVVAIAVAVYAPHISASIGWTGGVHATGAAITGGASAGLGLSGAVASGMLGGAMGGAIMTGSLKGTLTGAITGGAFGAVGDIAPQGFGNVMGHAAVGCVSSVAGGGKCGSGALAAGAGSAWSNYGFKMETLAGNVTMHAIVGGTASVAGGGKFGNGASTAAFAYLFNCLAHECNGADYKGKEPGHEYGPFASPVTCNVSNPGCLGATQREIACNSAPGQGGCVPLGRQVSSDLRGGNPITQYRPNDDIIINGTSDGHRYHDGYVVRWSSVDAAGDVRIWTYGIGVNTGSYMARENAVTGQMLFRAIGVKNALNVRNALGQ